MTTPGPRGRSALGDVVRSPLYRGAALSLFFAGLGGSIAMPQMSLFLVEELGATVQQAGLFFLTAVTAPLFGILVGTWSERVRDRLLLFRVGALIGCAGFAAMAVTDQLWLVFVLNATALGVVGATGGLVFAAVRDQLDLRPTGRDTAVMAVVRLAFSFGFMTGPVLGSVLGGLIGLRATLLVAAAATALQVVWLLGVRPTADPAHEAVRAAEEGGPAAGAEPAPPRARPRPHRTGTGPLLAFLGLAVVAMAGDTFRFAYLPLYMENQLGTDDTIRGLVISVQSLGMVVFTPLAGMLADRFGVLPLVPISVVGGVVANLGFAVGGNEVLLAVATVANAAMWAVLGGIGISAAYELHPTKIGLASSLYYSSLRFAAVIGGGVAAIGVGPLGIPGVFVLPAVLCALSAVGLAVLVLRGRRGTAEEAP